MWGENLFFEAAQAVLKQKTSLGCSNTPDFKLTPTLHALSVIPFRAVIYTHNSY